MAATDRAAVALESWEQTARTGPGGSLLEIGCGTAPLLVAASRRGYQPVGVDIAFRWLVVAKKRLMEAGVRAPLFCACAEALPFRESRFDAVALDSAIEVVADQPRVMTEAHRVLSSQGRLFLSTPNRFSLGPDPHLGVPAGGFWPKSWLSAFARRQGAIPPKRNLLWVWSLMRLIRSAGFSRLKVQLPRITEAQWRDLRGVLRAAVNFYRVAQHLPLTRQCLFLVGPLLYATAQKTGAPEPSR
jgi:SAM-dependent methyltransferase